MQQQQKAQTNSYITRFCCCASSNSPPFSPRTLYTYSLSLTTTSHLRDCLVSSTISRQSRKNRTAFIVSSRCKKPTSEREQKKRNPESSANPSTSLKAQAKIPSEMLAKFGQRMNISGVLSTFQVILMDQRLLLPHVSVPDISWIEWSVLRQRGFKGVVFDKDNTLTAPYQTTVWPSLAQSLEDCLQVFEGNVALLSNSAGLQQFDPDGSQAHALEASLGISVIRHRTKKPAGNVEDLVKHFGCDPSHLVMVGDRCLTDIVYGNKMGLCTIHTTLFSEIGEPLIVAKVRKMEDKLVEWCLSRELAPPGHKLMYRKFEVIKDPGCW